jgi:hypothetical protein
MDGVTPRLDVPQGDPLVYTAPFFVPMSLSNALGPAIDDYLNANLPILLPPYIDPAAEAAVQAIALLRAGDMATGAIRTTRLLATLDDEFATKSYVDTAAAGGGGQGALAQLPQPTGGFTSSPYPFGTLNECTALSTQMWPPDVATGRPTMPGVLGIWNAYGVANYSSRDMCTFYAGAHSGAPTTITVANATYTATTMVPTTPLTAAQVSFIQQAIAINNQRAPMIPAGYDNVGMLIDTQHTPNKYTGNITAVAPDGSSVTVQGWFAMGNTAAGQVPPNGVGAYINPCTKMWNMNGIMYLAAGTMCQQMTFLEIDAYNDQAAFAGGIIPTIGISANAHGNTGGYAFIGNGQWSTGFLAQGNTYAGFLIHPITSAAGQTDMNFGFVSQVRSDITGGHHPFAYWDFSLPVPGYRFSVGGHGGLNLGNPGYDNGFEVQVSSPGAAPIIQVAGPDTNINLRLVAKGTGVIQGDQQFLMDGGAEMFGYVSQVSSVAVPNHHPFAYFDLAGNGYRWSVGSNGSMNIGDPARDQGLAIAVSPPGGLCEIQAVSPNPDSDLVIRAKGMGLVRVFNAIQQNSSGVNIPPAGGWQPLLDLQGTDGELPVVQLTSYAERSAIIFRRADGAGASPTALVNGDEIGAVYGAGYDGTAWSGYQIAYTMFAGGAWSPASHPTYLSLLTTSAGSTLPTERLRVYPSGNVAIQPAGPPFTDTGGNALQVAGNVAINQVGGAWPTLLMNTPAAGTACGWFVGQRAGLTRWDMLLGSTDAETGGNAGSDFYLNSHNDAGGALSTPIRINRPTGQLNLTGAVVLLGTGGLTSGGTVTVNPNTVGNIPGAAGVIPRVNVQGVDNELAVLQMTTYAQPSGIFLRRGDGGRAATTALAANDQIGQLSAAGHNGAAWSGVQASIRIFAGAAWSAAAMPTYISFITTALASTAAVERMRVYSSGNVAINPAGPPFTDNGTDALQVNGSLVATQINVTAPTNSNIRSGTGVPAGTQPGGSLWLRMDGATGSRLYVSAGGGVWNAVTGV